MVTMVNNKAVVVADLKVVVMATVVVAETVVVVMAVAMVDMVLVVTETIKDVVGPATALTLNIGMVCLGKNVKPSQKDAVDGNNNVCQANTAI